VSDIKRGKTWAHVLNKQADSSSGTELLEET
jgi:hypothetical protein